MRQQFTSVRLSGNQEFIVCVTGQDGHASELTRGWLGYT